MSRFCYLYNVKTSNIAQCTHCTVHTLHSAQCTVHGAQCTVHGARCTVHGARCTVHGARCTVHCARCTVHTPSQYCILQHIDSIQLIVSILYQQCIIAVAYAN